MHNELSRSEGKGGVEGVRVVVSLSVQVGPRAEKQADDKEIRRGTRCQTRDDGR